MTVWKTDLKIILFSNYCHSRRKLVQRCLFVGIRNFSYKNNLIFPESAYSKKYSIPSHNININLIDFSPALHFILKPVIWFAMQIKWLVSIWNATLGWNGLNYCLVTASIRCFWPYFTENVLNIFRIAMFTNDSKRGAWIIHTHNCSIRWNTSQRQFTCQEQRHCRSFGAFEQISHIVLVFLLLTLNR